MHSNLYLTTVLSSCFFFVLLLSHLGSAGIRGACLTSAFISPGRTHFTVSCHLILLCQAARASLRALCWAEPAVRGSVCCFKLQVPISSTPAPVQLSPAMVRGQAKLGAEAEFGRLCCLSSLPWGAAPQLKGLNVQQRKCLLPPFFCYQPLVLFPCQWSGGSVLCHPLLSWVQALHTIAVLPLEHP
ncbi:hypothetical protein EK904_002242 [Melospiza melodia maxima]|nr:hypothetical protein EK904_002242 [Melospiza melodia maxima]